MYNITVTDAAKEKIAEMCLENNMVAVRPFVHGGGCSGMAHSMTFVEENEKSSPNSKRNTNKNNICLSKFLHHLAIKPVFSLPKLNI